MTAPNKQQIDTAMATAEYLREHDSDPDHLAHTLLYLRRRNQVLERVLDAAKHYLHSGQDQHTHIRLVQAVEAARAQSRREGDSLEPDSDFGLE